MGKKEDKIVQMANQFGSLSAGMTNLFASPTSAQGRYAQILVDNAKGNIQAHANYMARKEAEKKKTPWGKIGGTVAGLALAPFTGGASIPIGMGAGGAIDAIANKDYGTAIGEAAGAAGDFIDAKSAATAPSANTTPVSDTVANALKTGQLSTSGIDSILARSVEGMPDLASSLSLKDSLANESSKSKILSRILQNLRRSNLSTTPDGVTHVNF